MRCEVGLVQPDDAMKGDVCRDEGDGKSQFQTDTIFERQQDAFSARLILL